MLTGRLLRIVRSIGIGLSADEVGELVESVSLAVQAGVLRLGDYNAKLINAMSMAWTSNPFTGLTAHEYTHGDKNIPWLDSDVFRARSGRVSRYIRLPIGHPVKATYRDGHVTEVQALTFPGEYSTDITDNFAELFPSGVDKSIRSIYAVVSASETSWIREAWRTGQLLSSERGFIFGVDKLTLSWVDGCDLESFCDYGVLGALSLPVVDIGENVDKVVDNVDNSRGVLVGISDVGRSALYSTRVQVGEIVGMRTSAGSCSMDVVYLDIDTGDVVGVTDILTLRNLTEGSEVFYVCGDGSHVLCDEFGNELLGSCCGLFD